MFGIPLYCHGAVAKYYTTTILSSIFFTFFVRCAANALAEWLYKVEKITESFKKRILYKYLEDGGTESTGRICQFILVIFLLKTPLEL